nr:MAG: replication associated protein [Cressdnaviricota sp.]
MDKSGDLEILERLKIIEKNVKKDNCNLNNVNGGERSMVIIANAHTSSPPNVSKLDEKNDKKDICVLENVQNGDLETVFSEKNDKNDKKRGNQLTRWCFTLNNYTLKDIGDLETKFEEICKKYVFQEETGEFGTPHLQGSIWLAKKMRWSEFKLTERIFWSKMRNEDASILYCSKEETKSGKRWSKGFEKEDFIPPETLNKITYEMLRPWQKQVADFFINKPANDRLIYWIYSEQGNVGKSKLCTYFYDNCESCCFVDGVKKADIINGIFNYAQANPRGKKALGSKTVVLFDIPRNTGNKICYSAIESIKSELIFNTKFETGGIRFNSPHICIFANKSPVLDETVSLDRWRIYEIDDKMNLIYKDVMKK